MKETGGKPHSQDHAHFKAVRDEGNFQGATAAKSPDVQKKTLPDPDAPDAWKSSYQIFGDRVIGGLKDLNAQISRHESEQIDPLYTPGLRRMIVRDILKIGEENAPVSPSDTDERGIARRDGQFEGYLRGLQDARRILQNHITGKMEWVDWEKHRDGGWSEPKQNVKK
jgi:hypothetical protein